MSRKLIHATRNMSPSTGPVSIVQVQNCMIHVRKSHSSSTTKTLLVKRGTPTKRRVVYAGVSGAVAVPGCDCDCD